MFQTKQILVGSTYFLTSSWSVVICRYVSPCELKQNILHLLMKKGLKYYKMEWWLIIGMHLMTTCSQDSLCTPTLAGHKPHRSAQLLKRWLLGTSKYCGGRDSRLGGGVMRWMTMLGKSNLWWGVMRWLNSCLVLVYLCSCCWCQALLATKSVC